MESGFDHKCDFYVEVDESGAGYCLDSVGSSRVEQYAIGEQLRDRVPTTSELSSYQEVDALANLSVEDPRYGELEAALIERLSSAEDLKT